MKKQTEMNFKQIKKLWNSQPYLEKLLFLINQVKISQENADEIAKVNFDKINDEYKVKIYQILN